VLGAAVADAEELDVGRAVAEIADGLHRGDFGVGIGRESSQSGGVGREIDGSGSAEVELATGSGENAHWRLLRSEGFGGLVGIGPSSPKHRASSEAFGSHSY